MPALPAPTPTPTPTPTPAPASAPRAIGSSRASSTPASARPAASANAAAATFSNLPVYDLSGRPLGFFPLAPGVDPGALQSQPPPPMVGAASATPGRVVTALTPVLPRQASAAAAAPSAPAPAAASAAAFQQFQQFQLFLQQQQQHQQAAPPPPFPHRPAMPSSALASPGASAAENAQQASAAAVSAALSGMFNQRGPGSAAIAAMGGASPRQPKAPKDAASNPKDVYTSPTPSLLVAGGDVAVPLGAQNVTGQSFVPVGASGRGQTVDASAPPSESATSADPSPSSSSSSSFSPFMYSLAATGEQLAELSEARVLAETKVRELEKMLRQSAARAAILEKDLEDACSELDGKDSELRRLRMIERAGSRRPELLAPLLSLTPLAPQLRAEDDALSSTAQTASLSEALMQAVAPPLPFSGASLAADTAFLLELVRRLPALQTLPESVVREVVARSSTHALGAGALVADCPASRDSILVVIEGSAVLPQHLAAAAAAVLHGEGDSARLAAAPPVSVPTLTPAALAIGPGDYLCEHTLLNRAPRAAWRDPLRWVVRGELLVLALPSALLRRLLLTESALLDCWSESALAAAVSPAYSALRPPPRAGLQSDADAAALVSHAAMLRALRHLATGGHVTSAIAAERRSAARRAGSNGDQTLQRPALSDLGVVNEGSGDGGADDNDEDVAGVAVGEDGAAAHAAASVPQLLAQSAPMLYHLAHAAAHAAPAGGAPSERAIEAAVAATRAFFDCTAAALFEYDDSARVAQLARVSVRAVASTPTPTPAHLVLRAVTLAPGLLTPTPLLHHAHSVASLAGLCATTAAVVNVHDALSDTRFSPAVEPVAGDCGLVGARTLLCVPVFAALPGGVERCLCGVLQLIDKRANTAALFSPSQLRQDELSHFANDSAGPRRTLDDGAELAPFPGAVAVGGDGLPRYAFTQRDEELADLAARRIGDAVSASLRQLANATTNLGTTSADALSARSARQLGPDELVSASARSSGASSSGSSRDDTIDVPGLSAGVGSSGSGADDFIALAAGGTAAAASMPIRSVPLHAVTDALQWRARSLHAFAPLAVLASPLAIVSVDDVYGDADGAPLQAQYPPPATALLNGGGGDAAEGADLDEAGTSGAGAFASSPGTALSPGYTVGGVAGAGDAANVLDAAAPTSVYVYVRACVVVGRLPVTPDASSPSVRAVNGYAAGRVGNGPGSDIGAVGAPAVPSGSVAEGCTAHWGSCAGAVSSASAAADAGEAASPAALAASSMAAALAGLLTPAVTETRGFIDLAVRVCDLPRDARLVFAVHEEASLDAGDGGGAEGGGGGRPLFWTSCSLFTHEATLRTGTVLLPLHTGAWPGGGACSGADGEPAARAGLLEVDLGSVGVPPGARVIDCDLPRCGWASWRSLVAASGLRVPARSASGGGGGVLGPSSSATTPAASAVASFSGAASPLQSPIKPGLRGAAGTSVAAATAAASASASASASVAAAAAAAASSGDLEELVLDASFGPAVATAALLAARTPGPASATLLGLRVVPISSAAAVGGDSRGSQPLRVPSLQSAVPNVVPLAPSFGAPVGSAAATPRAAPGLGAGSGLGVLQRASPGVDLLSARDLALVRALKAGQPVADVMWPPRLPLPMRRLLWRFRLQLLAAAGSAALPVLLRASPCLYVLPEPGRAGDSADAPDLHSGAAALFASHALIRAACPLPPCVALQLLDSTFSDATTRSLALESLSSSFGRGSGALALLPALALVALHEPHLDSVTTRLLLAMAVEDPLRFGRHLGWMWRAALGTTGLRARSSRLVRALLDVSDEFAAPEFALQSFALTQIACACRRAALPQPRGTRSHVLRGNLAATVLPHRTRLPLRAHAPLLPATYFRALADGSLAHSIDTLVTTAVGDAAAPASQNGAAASPPAVATAASPESAASPPSGTGGAGRRGRGATDDSSGDEDDSSVEGAASASSPWRGGGAEAAVASPGSPDGHPAPPTAADAAAALVQDIEDSAALALVALGVFSDAAAFGLDADAVRGPAETLRTLTATVAAGGERDSRLPLSGAALHVATASLSIDPRTGSPRPALPYAAAVAAAVAEAAAVEAARRKSEAAATAAGDDDAVRAPPRVSAALPPPLGASLPQAGLCVGDLVPSACRVLFTNARRRYSRALLVFAVATDPDEARGAVPLPPGPIGVSGRVVRVRTHVPRPLRFRDGRVSLLAITADDATVASEALHAAMLSSMARAWREAGLRVGDAAGVYAFGVHHSASRDPVAASAVAAAAGGEGGLGGRLFGLLVCPPRGRTISEILQGAEARDSEGDEDAGGVHGSGAFGLSRWLMSNHFAREEGESADEAVDEARKDSQGEGLQYAAIVSSFAHSLAACVVGTYVLGLGERRRADLLLSPAGHVFLAGLSFEDGGGPLEAGSRFASRVLAHELLAVLGGSGVDGLIEVCVAAVLALRKQPGELLVLLLSHTQQHLPGCTTPDDVGRLRSRLVLDGTGGEDDATAAAIEARLRHFLHL